VGWVRRRRGVLVLPIWPRKEHLLLDTLLDSVGLASGSWQNRTGGGGKRVIPAKIRFFNKRKGEDEKWHGQSVIFWDELNWWGVLGRGIDHTIEPIASFMIRSWHLDLWPRSFNDRYGGQWECNQRKEAEGQKKKKKFIDLFQWLGPESNGLFLLNQLYPLITLFTVGRIGPSTTEPTSIPFRCWIYFAKYVKPALSSSQYKVYINV
jgi:hypothetical protein